MNNTFIDCTLDDRRRRILDNVNRTLFSNGRRNGFGRINSLSGGSTVCNVGSDVAWYRGRREDGGGDGTCREGLGFASV